MGWEEDGDGAPDEWGRMGDTVLQLTPCTKSHGGKSDSSISWKCECLHVSASLSETGVGL